MEILGVTVQGAQTGQGDGGLLCSKRAELVQVQSPPAQAQLAGNGLSASSSSVQGEEGEEEERTLRLSQGCPRHCYRVENAAC